MSEALPSPEAVQQILNPLFPGLMGVRIVALEAERVVAELAVRPDLCTTGGILHGGAYMAFADTLGAVGTFINRRESKRRPRIPAPSSSAARARTRRSRPNASPCTAGGPPWCGRRRSVPPKASCAPSSRRHS
jgi:hypothetical protein